MFNPVSKVNWVYKMFFEQQPKKTVVYHTSYKDNKFLDQDTIDTIENLANTNPAYYKIYALGEFATLDKLIFPKYEKRLIDREAIRHLPSFFGLDFGYVNDPSAFIHAKVDTTNRKLYIVEEYVKKGMLNDEIAKAIHSLGYAKEQIIADSAEQKSVAELRQHGISRVVAAKKPPGSILQGIQLIQQFDIIVDERCFNTILELDNYTWMKDKKTGEYINKPVDSYNHCLDALRYALQKLVFKQDNTKEKMKILRKLR